MNQIYSYQLSENFSAYEARCRGGMGCDCRGAVSADKRLVMILQHFRSLLGEPVTVTSWFRCRAHNDAVGGHPKSFHILGWAADITSSSIRRDMDLCSVDLAEILEGILGEGQGNIILYPARNFIHVDVGHRVGDTLIRRK